MSSAHFAPGALPPGSFVTVTKISPAGSLQARKQADGAVMFWWRFRIGTKPAQRVPVGLFDSTLPPKSLKPTGNRYSLAAAIRAAEAMAVEHHANRDTGGLPGIMAARKAAEATAEAARRAAQTQTLKHLLDDYCDQLEAMHRRSHIDARSLFRIHVCEAWPKLAARPANEITMEDVSDMMRKCLEAGKARTANKLRSYLRAAFQMAKAARSKPSIPLKFKAYGVTQNPAADTEPDETANRPAKHPLTVDQLRAYWKAIRTMPGIPGAMLRLHLLTGGQRIEQLVKVSMQDIHAEGLMLWDGKGRPGQQPRQHLVPLIPAAENALGVIMSAVEVRTGTYALTTDGGKTHINALTVTRWSQDAAPPSIKGMQAKRIRSGVETLLAGAGVSKEIRGRLLSHGIGGVQDRNYDGHDYLKEKRQALMVLWRVVSADVAKAEPKAPKARARRAA